MMRQIHASYLNFGKKNAAFGTASKFGPNARRRRFSMSHMAASQIVRGGPISAIVAGDRSSTV
jgi:hypothetical protein